MSNHPNRSRRKDAPAVSPRLAVWLRDRDRGKTPSPEQVRKTRWFAGLTQAELAERMHRSKRAVEEWESGRNPMHPNDWLVMRCICYAALQIAQARHARAADEAMQRLADELAHERK